MEVSVNYSLLQLGSAHVNLTIDGNKQRTCQP
jgi:hypothetical protein